MRRPVPLPFRIVLVILFTALLACPVLGQDTWTGVERIVAVGDVHGDFNQFVKTLRAAKVIDEKNDWIAGKTHLVQTGDVLDRGPDSRKAMDLLMKLETQAAKAGGAVHPLVGNHEAMVLRGDQGYLSPEEIASFGGQENMERAMSAEGAYGKWIRSHNAVIKINDILFVHGGLTPEVARMSLADINKAIRDDLNTGSGTGLAMKSSGPLWDRSLARMGDDAKVSAQIDKVLSAYDAHHIVIGHTVSAEGVLALANGRLIRIDVGMFEGYGGPAACLVVEKDGFYEVRHPDTRRKLDVPLTTAEPAKDATAVPAR